MSATIHDLRPKMLMQMIDEDKKRSKAYDKLRGAAFQTLTILKQQHLGATYCECCNGSAPRYGEHFGEVEHGPECVIRILEKGLEG